MLMDPQFGFASGAGLGLGFTPRGTGYTPVAMQMTGSSGGINGILAAQDQEDERKRRIEAIAATVAGRWGFVSQEGVERCAKRLGLDALWEDGMGGGKRMLTVAGTAMLLEVEFEADDVMGCVLSFPGSGGDVGGRAAGGAEVLRRNLKGEGYVRLEGFVENMEILGRMDRLGGEKISCFDATGGLFKSLDRLWRWEAEREKQQGKTAEETEVMCRRSGRPRMHTRGRVGLALQYWMERRLVLEDQEKKADEMDVDDKEASEVDDEADIWSAIIECESSSAELYPSIRVSDAWVSEAVEKPTPAESNNIPGNDPSIDWQDPPPTLLAADEQGDSAVTATESNPPQQPKPPDVRFVARFEPPVVVPLQTALQVHNSVGSPISQEMILSTTYESLLFAGNAVQTPPPAEPRTMEKTVTSYDSATNTSTSHVHKYSLFAQQQDWARAITHLPFSHPRQIVAVLPILRQWALTGSILRRAFSPNTEQEPTAPPTANAHPTRQTDQSPSEPPPTKFQTLDAELAAFMSSPLPLPRNAATKNPASSSSSSSSDDGGAVRDVQVTFKATPVPQFQLHFPNPRHGGKLAALNFMVGLNGVVGGVDVLDGRGPAGWGGDGGGVINGEGRDGDGEEGREMVRLREGVARALEVGECVGVAVEWAVGRGK